MVEHGLYMVISWSTMFLKHGRPCLKHGQPCFDRVHFTGVTPYVVKMVYIGTFTMYLGIILKGSFKSGIS